MDREDGKPQARSAEDEEPHVIATDDPLKPDAPQDHGTQREERGETLRPLRDSPASHADPAP